ncbi:polysaccharide biosynthesis/export family protein [Consotaella aegiceratis]|uniref:polysaccharide biosynthesis/export family protein n=1 Tax=Consotaella aegiceratis TaxID=3097961 RepID=UPI002F420B9B
MGPRILVTALLCAVLGACSSYRPTPPAFHEALNQPYRLDAGDRVRVTVFEQESLTNTYAVDKAGYITAPLIGSVPARGRTTGQLAETLEAKYGEGYLRDPDISVEVDQYRPFFIMGEVGAAGQYSYVPGMTVQNAIAIAGGFTPRADQSTADITRQVNGRILTGRVLTSDPILPSDTIYVRERLF